MAIDVLDILNKYDENNKAEKPEIKKPGANNAFGDDRSRQAAVKSMIAGSNGNANSSSNSLEGEDARRMAAARKIIDNRDGLEPAGLKMPMADYQKFLRNSFANTLATKNVQKMIIIANRDGARKGLSVEIGNMGLSKSLAGRGQTSTITIPTQLLRYVQQEIGGLSVKATQNDIMAGFLYWYFGRPEDVHFGSEETANKIAEITAGLDANSSPARLGRMSYNTSNATLDRLDALIDKVDQILSLAAGLTQDSLNSKIKDDKIYLALCYNILNMLAFTPPTMPGDKAQDVDILAGGLVWDLMVGIDSAYDYYKAKNGREIYKSKFRANISKPAAASGYTPFPTAVIDNNINNSDINNGDINDSDEAYYEEPVVGDDYDYDDYDEYEGYVDIGDGFDADDYGGAMYADENYISDGEISRPGRVTERRTEN